MKRTLFLDMDGVLVDFVKGALEIHNAELPRREVKWGFPSQIGFAQGAGDPLFWAPMGHSFWAKLDWTAEGETLLAGLERMFGADNIALMSSPADTEGAVEGKVAWIARNLPAYRRRFFIGPQKHLAAGPGKVLIDDHDPNCAAFALAGGVALTPPRPWNMRHDECDGGGNFDVRKFLNEVEAALP